MNAPTPNRLSHDGLAPVITLATRRARPHSAFRSGAKGLGLALVLGAGVAASLAALGLLATMAIRHAVVVLPAVVVLATLAAWPATARRFDDGEDIPPFPGSVLRADEVRGRVLQHPAGRKLNRG